MSGGVSLAPAALRVEHRADGSVLLSAPAALEAPPATLFAWLDRWADSAPDRAWVTEVAPSGHRVALTYAQARAEVERRAGFWRGAGLRAGDRVVISLPNSIEHLLWSLAVMRAGGVYVAVPPQYVGPRHDERKLAALMSRIAPSSSICSDPGEAGRLSPFAPARTREELGREAQGTPPAPLLPLPAADDVAKLVLTSGSTGEPKAVPYRHGQMTAEIAMTRQCWPFVVTEPPVLLDWLPWNHSFGGTVNLYLVLASGGTLHIDDGGATQAGVRRTLEQVGDLAPTIHLGVPSTLGMIRAELEADARLAAAFFRSVRAVFTAGAALQTATFEAFERMARESGREVVMLSGWGSTEVGPGATIVHVPDARPGWIGLPMPGVQLKLVPESGKLHLTVRGPNVFDGYWRDEAATRAAFDAEGFFRTGDAGRLVDRDRPERGLVFDGRVGDDFKLANGTWINYARVRERLLTALEGRATDVVLGMPDADALVALVWPRDGVDLDRGLLQAAVARHNDACRRPSDRLRALACLATPPGGEEVSPKSQLRPSHVRERRRQEFRDLVKDGGS